MATSCVSELFHQILNAFFLDKGIQSMPAQDGDRRRKLGYVSGLPRTWDFNLCRALFTSVHTLKHQHMVGLPL